MRHDLASRSALKSLSALSISVGWQISRKSTPLGLGLSSITRYYTIEIFHLTVELSRGAHQVKLLIRTAG